MPLSEKESKKLITDLAKYIEEERWAKQDIGKLEKAQTEDSFGIIYLHFKE